MAKTIEEVIIKTRVEGANDVNGLKKSINDLKSDIAGAGQVGGAFGNTLNGIIGKLGPLGFAAAAAGTAIAGLAMTTLNSVDALSDLSDATGINASSLLNFKQSLVQAGGNLDTFEKFASKLSVSIGEAADGNEAYKKSFRELGVNTVDVNGQLRNSQVILEETIAALAKIEDPATRARIAVSLMGKEASKIDWSKVSAGKDAFTDDQIAQLNKYNDQLKKLRETIDRELIKAFGNLADAINNGGWVETLAAGVEEMGKLISLIPGLGKVSDLVDKARMERLGNRAGGGRGGQGGPTAQELADFNKIQTGEGGTAGKLGEAAELASIKRIQDAKAAYSLSMALMTRDEQVKIAAQTTAEIAKITSEVNANEQLKGPEGAKQREAEIAARSNAALAKGAVELYNIEQRVTDQIRASNLSYNQLVENFSRGNIESANQLTIQTRSIGLGQDAAELYQQQEAILTRSRLQVIALQQEAEKIKLTLGIDPTAEERLLKNAQAIRYVKEQTDVAIATNKSYVSGLQELRSSEAAYQFALGLTNQAQLNAITAKGAMIGLTATENEKIINAIKLQKDLAIAQKLQEEQSKLGRKDGELVPIKPERIAEIKKQIGEFYDEQGKQTQEQINKSREFGIGWEQAYKQYAENATNAAEQARSMFSTVTRGIEDVIVNFVKTGKLSFKDFANSVIEQFVRIQAQQLALGIFGGSGAQSVIGSMLGFPGRAKGGPVDSNTPYMVGEVGPELFVPRTAGTIVPNNQLGGGGSNVTYNINAVDASSFRQLVASDPEFLYAVTEKGRSSIPNRR
ncbi:phage tail tape measure C-terminal domain-containing protein [Brevundimonas sp.]|jgi:lambda family phage tail tape measure protein|uniref:phage tail tape measure C-terminal domain-containing protein n=1 Tax=Brevundimonas sp. TaxID=1871086 RepID=UPI003784E9F0